MPPPMMKRVTAQEANVTPGGGGVDMVILLIGRPIESVVSIDGSGGEPEPRSTHNAPMNLQLTPVVPSSIPTPTMPPTMHWELELGRPCVVVVCIHSVRKLVMMMEVHQSIHRSIDTPTPTYLHTHPLRRDEDDEGRGQFGGKATGRGQTDHLRAHGASAVWFVLGLFR